MSTFDLPWPFLPDALEARLREALSFENELRCCGSASSGELITEFGRLSKKHPDTARDYVRDLIEAAEWLAENTGKGILAAETPDLVRYFDHLERAARRREETYTDAAGRERRFVLRQGPLAPSSLMGQKAAIGEFFKHCARMVAQAQLPRSPLLAAAVAHPPRARPPGLPRPPSRRKPRLRLAAAALEVALTRPRAEPRPAPVRAGMMEVALPSSGPDGALRKAYDHARGFRSAVGSLWV